MNLGKTKDCLRWTDNLFVLHTSYSSCNPRVFLRAARLEMNTPVTRWGYAAAVLERLRFNWLHTSGLSALWDDKGHRWERRSGVQWLASDPIPLSNTWVVLEADVQAIPSLVWTFEHSAGIWTVTSCAFCVNPYMYVCVCVRGCIGVSWRGREAGEKDCTLHQSPLPGYVSSRVRICHRSCRWRPARTFQRSLYNRISFLFRDDCCDIKLPISKNTINLFLKGPRWWTVPVLNSELKKRITKLKVMLVVKGSFVVLKVNES